MYNVHYYIIYSSLIISSYAIAQASKFSIQTNNQSCLVHEVVIIGSGPSGCTAAIYTGRAVLNPIVVAGYISGGQLMLTSDVENFPGYQESVPGPKLMEDLTYQAKRFGAIFLNKDCDRLDLHNYPFRIFVNDQVLLSKSIILSTGAKASWLDAESENMYKGKGISTCATCDGYLFKNKSVIVIGGGDSAMEEAIFLTRFARKVTIIHRRDTFKCSKVN